MFFHRSWEIGKKEKLAYLNIEDINANYLVGKNGCDIYDITIDNSALPKTNAPFEVTNAIAGENLNNGHASIKNCTIKGVSASGSGVVATNGGTIDNVSILDTDAVDEESDTIVGGRFASILYIADEATANEVFNLFNDYLAGSCGDAEETSYEGGQRFDYADGCYASIDYNEDISYYKINVAIDINV